MTRIVSEYASTEETSLANLLRRKIPCLANVPLCEAERYWMSMYPGFTLHSHEITSDGVQQIGYFYLSPTSDPVCPNCGQTTSRIKDSKPRTVIEQPLPGLHRTYIHFHLRRVRCKCGCCKNERLPWLDPKQRITRRAASAVQQAVRLEGNTISKVSSMFGINRKAVKELDKRQLKKLFDKPQIGRLRRIAIDESALHKGHRYATAFMDLDTGQVFAVAKGKRKDDIRPVFEDLKQRGLLESIECVAVDMNAGFAAVAKDYLPQADVIYDLFHILQNFTAMVLAPARKHMVKLKAVELREEFEKRRQDGQTPTREWLNKQLRDVRRDYRKSEWLLVTPADALKPERQQRLEKLIEDNALLAALYPVAGKLRELWRADTVEDAMECLADIIEILKAVSESFDFKEVLSFARLLENHSDGILNACKHRVGTNRLEGANNKIKVLKRNAYGFKDFEYFALKVKGLLPGKGCSAWWELSGFKMVDNEERIVDAAYEPLPLARLSNNACQALQSA